MNTLECNFDGLVGQTHHYGGLAAGNLASQLHRLQTSYPRTAALQGLAKMRMLADLGIPQAVFPPHERPHFQFLREQGFDGSEREIIEKAARERPDLLSIAYSAAAMWTANAATVSPSADTFDSRVHLTPANLISSPHRKLETEFTHRILTWNFGKTAYFAVHDPLPDAPLYSDEGAANHTRLCVSQSEPGFEIFTYGANPDDATAPRPKRFAARQTLNASKSISRQHQIFSSEIGGQALFVQQNPEAIDAGVFHNDVIAVGNENVLLCHEQAFVNQQSVLTRLRETFPGGLHIIEVAASELSLADAVATYLFNSQLVTLPGEEHEMLLVCPSECETHPHVRPVIDRILAEPNPIHGVHFVDLRQSMQNGGGPACLRLRVVLTEQQRSHVQGNIWLTDDLHSQLQAWISKHYREELTLADLADWQLVEEVRDALDDLTTILQMPVRYPFQL